MKMAGNVFRNREFPCPSFRLGSTIVTGPNLHAAVLDCTPKPGRTRVGEPLEWLGAAPLRVLDDFDRRQADGLPRARARGTAADLRAAAAQERQRHDAVVCARQAVGIARSGARRFSSPEAGAVRAARAPNRSSRRHGAARRPTGVRAARTRIRGIDSRKRIGPSARGRRRIRPRSAIATSPATSRSRAASGATNPWDRPAAIGRGRSRPAIGRGRPSRAAIGPGTNNPKARPIVCGRRRSHRTIEIYNGKPIFYGISNFIYQNSPIPEITDPSRPDNGLLDRTHQPDNKEALLTTSRYEEGQLVEVRLYPVDLGIDGTRPVSRNGQPLAASPQQAERILKIVQDLSRPFGTSIAIENGVGVILVGH